MNMDVTQTAKYKLSKEQAQAKLDALIQAKVEAALQPMRDEVVKSRRERIDWFYAGYDAGMQDNPLDSNPAGKPFTIEQRKTRAAAQHAIHTNNHRA